MMEGCPEPSWLPTLDHAVHSVPETSIVITCFTIHVLAEAWAFVGVSAAKRCCVFVEELALVIAALHDVEDRFVCRMLAGYCP